MSGFVFFYTTMAETVVTGGDCSQIINFIMDYNNNKRCKHLQNQGRLRFNGQFLSNSQFSQIQMDDNCSTLFVTISATKYERLTYFKQTGDTMNTVKRTFSELCKKRSDCKHIYNAKETFTYNDLTQMMEIIKLHMKTRNYQNFIFIAQGYGKINLKKKNQTKDYFRFTDGSKLILNEFECQFQNIIPRKTKRQIGWDLLPKYYGKKCGYQSCDKAQCNRKFKYIRQPEEFYIGHFYCTFNKFKLCKRCKSIYYCCRNHQKKDWKRHKNEQCIKQKIM